MKAPRPPSPSSRLQRWEKQGLCFLRREGGGSGAPLQQRPGRTPGAGRVGSGRRAAWVSSPPDVHCNGLVVSHGPVHAAVAKAASWRLGDQKAEWRDQSPHSQFDFSRSTVSHGPEALCRVEVSRTVGEQQEIPSFSRA